MKLVEERTLYAEKWARLKEVAFLDREGAKHSWTYVERPDSHGAVVVVPVTEKSRSIILIRQFRVPFGRDVIEFPAGLIEAGESAEEAAIRELSEETGYSGVIEEIGPPVSTSAGITTETVTMVRARVGEEPASKQRLEGTERIEVLKLGPGELRGFLAAMNEQGVLFDAKLYVYLAEHRGAGA